MFVAHIDESGKDGGPLFVVACLASTPGRWIKFIENWVSILHEAPKQEQFKYSKASGRSKLEAKIPRLLGVINQHVERADILAISVPAYKEIFEGRISKTFDSPFHQGYVSIMAQSLAEMSKGASHKGRVDFVFDDMPDVEFAEVCTTWNALKRKPPSKAIKKLIGSEPSRRKAKEVIPLQGGDLLAGLMWRACCDKGSAPKNIRGLTIKHRAMLWDEHTLPQLIVGITKAQREHGILYEDGDRRALRLASKLEAIRLSRKAERGQSS